MRFSIAPIAGLTALAMLSACDRVGSTQDVEFLRGCWALRPQANGPVSMMLRLLPDGPDVSTYRGVIQELDVDGRLQPTVELWFSRDGRWMQLTNHDPNAIVNAYKLDRTPVRNVASRPPEQVVREIESAGARWAAFSEKGLDAGQGGWIVASGTEESLGLMVLDGDGEHRQTIFGGSRDGCD